jgi:hypothetical protein
MLREIFVVKNNTTNDIELKDFGIIISSGQTVELAEYDKSVISNELYNLLISGDLTRYINNLPVTDVQFLYSTSNNYYLASEEFGSVINVSKTGSSFTSINSALNSILNNTTNNRFLIQVSPDLFVEDIIMKPFVTIQGISSYARIQGKIIFNFTGSTNSSRIENIEVRNYDDDVFDIDTDGIVIINNINAKSFYTLPSVNMVRSVYNIRRGIVNIAGISSSSFFNNNTGTTKSIDTIYFVNGTGVTNLISFNASHQLTTYEQNTFTSIVYNENTNPTTDISIKDSYDYFYLNNSVPNNIVSPVIHSGATNNTGFSTSRVVTQPMNTGTIKVLTSYNTDSYVVTSTIYNYFNSYTWDNTKINDTDIYLGASITFLDEIRVINCFFKTQGDNIPDRYNADGQNGVLTYSVTNNDGTQANYGQIRVTSLYLGTDISGSGGTSVNTLLNEENLISDSVSALPTQHSVKKYVDNVVSGISTVTYVTQTQFKSYTGTTGLQEITEINAGTNIESSFSNGLVVEKIRPITDTTTAIQINKSNGVTPIITIDTVSGFTGHKIDTPNGLVHIYGSDNYDDNTGINTQTNAFIIDGTNDIDKDVQWAEQGVPKWLAETYRGEKGDFWYLYNVESDNSPLTVTETGRIGINKQPNFIDIHPLLVNNIGLNDLVTSGVYSETFNTVYELEIFSTGVTDMYHWRKSIDDGITYGLYSVLSSCTLTEVELEYGVTISFLSITGHTIGQLWRFVGFTQIPQATMTIAPMAISSVLRTDDYTSDIIIYEDLTSFANGGLAGQNFTLFESGVTGTIQSLYFGVKSEIDSIYVDLAVFAESVILITEYFNGVSWVSLTFNDNLYLDNTNNLTRSGVIYWNHNTLSGWTYNYLPDLPNGPDLLWMRLRTSSNPSISPISNSLSIGNDKRFAIYSAYGDYRPTYYVDARGRMNVGGGNMTGSNKLQVNTGNNVTTTSTGTDSLVEFDSQDSSVIDLKIKLCSNDKLSPGVSFVKTRGTLDASSSILYGDLLSHIDSRGRIGLSGRTLTQIISQYTGDGTNRYADMFFSVSSGGNPVEMVRITSSGTTGFGISDANAFIHITSGNTSIAPLKFTSGSLLNSPQVGVIEFVNNSWYGTITSGITRKTFAFLENPTFIGTPELPSGTTLNGNNLYDFILTSGGSNSIIFVSTNIFNTYTGTTVPNTYLTIFNFNTYTGTTGLQEVTNINAITTNESTFSGGISTNQIRTKQDNIFSIKNYENDRTSITVKTNSGFTGFGIINPKTLIHIYGIDNDNTNPLGFQTNALRIDGTNDIDKDVQWAENGIVKWMAETYRNENGKFWYLWSQEDQSTPFVASQGGRVGINNPSNIIDYHIMKIVGNGDGLNISGTYDKNFLRVYQIKINSTTGVTDTYIWRLSKDGGLSYESWSNESGVTTTPSIFSNGIELTFDSLTGNTVGDTWEFGAFPQLPIGTFVVTPVGFKEALKTDDYTAGTIIYEDITAYIQNSDSSHPIILFNSGITNSAFFIGALVEFDSIFVNLLTKGTDIILISEYWTGTQWIDISINNDFYEDNTNNLNQSGEIIWDSSILSGWTKSYLTDKIEVGYELFWMRFRSASPPTVSPISNNIIRAGNKRFAVNNSPFSYKPSFYIDSLGRTNIGGGDITGYNKLQINTEKNIDVIGYNTSLVELDSNNADIIDLKLKLSSDDSKSAGFILGKTRGTLIDSTNIMSGDSLGHIYFAGLIGSVAQTVCIVESIYTGDGNTRNGDLIIKIASDNIAPTEKIRISNNGTGFGVSVPTARIHIQSGSTTIAPMKFSSGNLLTSSEIGTIEFVNDSWYGTITSGAERKTFAFLESPHFTGIPNLPSGTTFDGTVLYDFILTSGGTNNIIKLDASTFNTYTGNTEIIIDQIETNITELSGWTETKLDTSTFITYTGSTIPWTQVSKSGSSLANLDTRNASDLNISVPDWSVTNVNDFVQASAQYTEDTQGSGRITPETVLWGRLTNTLTISGGTGYITYTGFHKYISWSTQSFNWSGQTEGTYYVYVDVNSTIQIVMSEPDNIHNITLGYFYWGGTIIGVIQQNGCIILNSISRVANFALRQGTFIYDNNGNIQVSGNSLKILSTPCKVQFGLLDTQLTEVSSDDANSYRFSNFYNTSDLMWETNYYFGFNQGKIIVDRWNDITKYSYVELTGYTATFTQYSNTVTSTSNLTSLISSDNYIYLSGDTHMYMTPVSSVTWSGSLTTIILESTYLGLGGIGEIIANYSIPKLPSGKYAKHMIARTIDDSMFFVLGQTYFDTEADTITGALPGFPSTLLNNTIKMAYIVSTSGMTDLTDHVFDIRPLPFQFKEGGQIGGGATITVHGELSGLAADDHLQYLRTDGTRNIIGIQSYQSHPTFTSSVNIVDKKYVDDIDILKLNLSDFNTFTGITLPSTYLNVSTYNIFTGTTLPTNYVNLSTYNIFTGTTLPTNYVNLPTYNIFTGTTAPNTYLTISLFNIYSGNTFTLIGTKQDTITGGASTITSSNLSVDKVLISNSSGKVATSTTTSLEILYISGVTSSVQPQLNSKAPFFSPSLSGTPTSTTAAVNTNTTQIATTAFVVGQASELSPLMNGTVYIGTSLRYTREDHVHPSDTSKLNVTDFNTFSGITLPTLYTSLSTYDTFTGITNTNISVLSGWTETKLDTSIFNTYTIVTAPSVYLKISNFNTYSGNTITTLASKQDTITGGASSITLNDLLVGKVLISDGSGKVSVSNTTATEIDYVSGVTSSIQYQINLKAPLISPQLSGTPTSTTAAVNTNTTQIATTAFVVGQAGITNPLMDGTTSIGTSLLYARQDHVHPNDNSKLSLTGGTMTGTLNGTNINLSGDLIATGSTYLVNTTSGTSSRFLVIDSATHKIGDSLIDFNVYGSNYQQVQDLTSTSTNATTPGTTKLTMNTTSLPSGRYKITMSWIWSRTGNNNTASFDLTISGVTQDTNTIIMHATNTADWYPATKIYYVTLSGSNTILFRYWGSSSGNNTYVSDATMELIRVS